MPSFDFQLPEPDLVARIRQGLQMHKRHNEMRGVVTWLPVASPPSADEAMRSVAGMQGPVPLRSAHG